MERCIDTYTLAIVVEEGLELDNVRVPDDAHDLEFAVLLHVSPRGGPTRMSHAVCAP